MTSITFRKATVVDLPDILINETAAYTIPWTEQALCESILQHEFLVMIEQDSGRVFGHTIYQIVTPESHLLNICIHPRHQGQGFGRLALRHWVALSKSEHCESCWLEVRKSNEKAQKLYQEEGFQLINIRQKYYRGLGETNEDGLVMRLEVATL